MKTLLTADQIQQAVEKLTQDIREATQGRPVAIVGIRSRGDAVAERICSLLAEEERKLFLGTLDISLYRDDLTHLHETPKLQSTEIDFPMDGAHVILVDDVLFTGRTIRAALDALSDYGRPEKIELAALVDRGHREMPIQPNYVGVELKTERMDRVIVSLEESDGKDAVELLENEE